MSFRPILVAALAALAAVALAAPAAAHPLGNFSVNRMSIVQVDEDQVRVRYVLDQAEIPTFQQRRLRPEQVLAAVRGELARGLTLRVDDRPVALQEQPGAALRLLPGQGGLRTTRIELTLAAPASGARRVELRDETYAERVGWKAIVPQPGKGTEVRASLTAADPTNGLRAYPQELLDTPRDQRVVRLDVAPGEGRLLAPEDADGGGTAVTRSGGADGFAAVLDDAAAGRSLLLVLLLAAFGWGALHALSPGHGKAMVAAYLVGTRGTPRHAVALGAVVTLTHTIGVFALGIVALLLSQYVLPETLYPWLNLVAGLLVVVIGAGVLRSRWRWWRSQREHEHDHGHGHHHDHDDHHHHHGHEHDHGHDHHDHGHGHDHHVPDRLTWKGLVGMGTAAGLIPCPSALVVLLGAIAQQQLALGLLLIVAFSLGLAATLTGLGLLVVSARRLATRARVPAGAARALPALSALVIVAIGIALTARALPQVL